jgi:hypothetical protein
MNSQPTNPDLSTLATLAGLMRLALVLVCAPAMLAAALVASVAIVLAWPAAWLVRSLKRLPAPGLRRRHLAV